VADVTLIDISDGVRATWGGAASLTAIVPAARVYFQRAAEGTALPYVVYTFDDVSAYFGGTEYFSGSKYIKVTRVNFDVYGTRAVGWSTLAQAMSDTFGWTTANSAGSWVIDNAVILSAMPEVEALEVTDERVAGEDIQKYSSSFTVKMQADRG
jgi:hypothetical protein